MTLKPQRDAPDLLKDIPRGHPNRYLTDQAIPQARFLDQESIQAHSALAYDPARPNGKILIGALGEKLIGVADDRHIITTAGTRAGKSVTVMANAFFYDGSMICNDGKGEIAERTAQIQADNGHEVYALDPYRILKGAAAKFRARFNPIKTLNLESPDVIEDAHTILEAIVIENPNSKDPHWDESAKNTLLGLLLFTAFGSDIPDERRTLGTMRDLLNGALRKEQIELPDGNTKSRYALPARILNGIEPLRQTHIHIADAIEASVRGLYEMGREEMPAVISSAKRHTAFLDFKPIRDVLSGHDFDLEDLKRESITVYLVLPQRRIKACRRWTRLFYTLLPAAIERERNEPDVPVLAVIDEFPTLGHMAELEDSVGRMAGHGLKFWFILQDWSQGQSIYKDRWESFAANCGTSQFFGNVDLTTTEYVCRRLGKSPVISTRSSDATADQMDRGQQGNSQNAEMHDLMTPSEISRYFARDDAEKRQLVLLAGKHPLIIQRVEWWNEHAPYAAAFSEGR